MKNLVFITSHFPFGKGETFIDSEFPFLEINFDRIIIIAQDASGNLTRTANEKTTVIRYNTSTSLTGFVYMPALIIKNTGSLIKLVKEENVFRKSIGRPLNAARFLHLFKRLIKVFQLRDFIVETLTRQKINENIVFYSYWLRTGAQAISLLDYRSSIKIARAHGSDIYEEKTRLNYLPLLSFMVKRLNAVFFISENGEKYLSRKTGNINQPFILSYLGVNDHYCDTPPETNADKFVIVSCSNIIALKRLDLIIRALEVLDTEKELVWLHFGEGEQKDFLTGLAKEKLGKKKNISYKFMGFFNNDELLDFYCKNRVDLLINTSITEGIPVSMMEAQCAGIPIVATDVGGVSEIVTDGTGFLIPSDFTPQQLAGQIATFIEMDENKIMEIRYNARKNWKLNFNAITNYTKFIECVNDIFIKRTNCS